VWESNSGKKRKKGAFQIESLKWIKQKQRHLFEFAVAIFFKQKITLRPLFFVPTRHASIRLMLPTASHLHLPSWHVQPQSAAADAADRL
jgi:hypothetical protein